MSRQVKIWEIRKQDIALIKIPRLTNEPKAQNYLRYIKINRIDKIKLYVKLLVQYFRISEELIGQKLHLQIYRQKTRLQYNPPPTPNFVSGL